MLEIKWRHLTQATTNILQQYNGSVMAFLAAEQVYSLESMR